MYKKYNSAVLEHFHKNISEIIDKGISPWIVSLLAYLCNGIWTSPKHWCINLPETITRQGKANAPISQTDLKSISSFKIILLFMALYSKIETLSHPKTTHTDKKPQTNQRKTPQNQKPNQNNPKTNSQNHWSRNHLTI